MKDGIQKSAVLLMALGEEAAAEVFKHLDPRQVQGIVAAMAQMQPQPHDTVESILTQYTDDSVNHQSLVPDTQAYVRSVLDRALGGEKANLLLDRVLEDRDTSGIESLKWMDAKDVAELIRNEHPQITATVLSHLDSDQAASVLNEFDEQLRYDVVTRIATLNGIQPLALEDLNAVLARALSGNNPVKKITLGGVKTAAEILNLMGSNNKKILESISTDNPDLSQKLADQMFVFGDLISLDDKGIQVLLREIANDALIISIKGCEPELREKFLKNMSQRAAQTLREDLESKGPVRLADVEAQQKEILKTARRLADEGQIMLSTGGGDDGFV